MQMVRNRLSDYFIQTVAESGLEFQVWDKVPKSEPQSWRADML